MIYELILKELFAKKKLYVLLNHTERRSLHRIIQIWARYFLFIEVLIIKFWYNRLNLLFEKEKINLFVASFSFKIILSFTIYLIILINKLDFYSDSFDAVNINFLYHKYHIYLNTKSFKK